MQLEPWSDIDPILAASPLKLRPEIKAYIFDLCRKDEWYGIDPESLGFMQDYVDIARMLARHSWRATPAPWGNQTMITPGQAFTIYDVGCATALQHMLFAPDVKYIGIDSCGAPEPRFFRPGCTFIRGKFSEVVQDLEIAPNAFGIANMSLFCGGSVVELEAFDKAFRRKWVL